MKNLKIALSAMLLVAGVIAFSSFKSNSYNKKAFTTICYYFIGEQSPESIEAVTNWTNEEVPNPPSDGICTGGTLLCGICFEQTEFTFDATFLTDLNSALSTAPSGNGVVITVQGKSVTIYRKA